MRKRRKKNTEKQKCRAEIHTKSQSKESTRHKHMLNSEEEVHWPSAVMRMSKIERKRTITMKEFMF